MNTLIEHSTRTPLEDAPCEEVAMTGPMAVLEVLPTPILAATRDWTLLHVNAAWEALTGWKRSEVLGTRLHNWVQPVDEVRLQGLSNCPGGVESRLGSRWDVGLRLKGGGWSWVDLAVQWKPGEDFGEEGRFLCVLTDVGSRRRHEERLRQALETERRLVQRTNQFVAMVSHELRLPVANIGYAAELLSSTATQPQPERQQRYLKSILDHVKRLNRLADQLAVSGQIESGHWRFAPEILDLRDLCQTVARGVEAEGLTTSRIRLELPETPVWSQGDPQLLELALSNLVSNALKYSPADAKVRIVLSTTQATPEIRVCDQGVGIRTEDALRLFQPFQRGSNVGGTKGNGLGLVICRTCLDLHGGALEWNRGHTGGTEFSIKLPPSASA